MRKVSLNVFLKTMRESCQNERRYCFILGAGASRESGIKTGEEMARIWYREINEKYAPEEREAIMGELGIGDITPSSETYFDLYALRFYPDYHNGSAYLERVMERAQPSFGYYPLATHLASTENNLVITTNFDSLVEDALFIYTDKRPLVISHELLADYININTKRPIVAKIHRGLFFDPLNRKEEVTGLPEKWKSVLRTAFQVFTPVFIGYAGGDHSLMDFLKEDSVKMNGLYWCYRHETPSAEIQALVESKGGYFVPIEGFDEMMYLLGQEFGYKNPGERILKVARQRAGNYDTQLNAFHKKLGTLSRPTQTQSQIMASLSKERLEEMDTLNRRLERNPSDVEAYRLRARLFRRANAYSAAVNDLNAAIPLAPDRDDLYNERGISYYEWEQYARAVEDYTAAIQRNPEESVYYCNRGMTYDELGEYEKAVADLTHSIELYDDDASVYIQRGNSYTRLGQYEQALTDFAHAEELDPEDSCLYNSRGYTYHEMGRLEAAVAQYTRAISLSPEYATAYNNRAAAYVEQGAFDLAVADCEKALSIRPDYPNAYCHRGRAKLGLGNYRDAAEDFTQAIRLNPRYALAYRSRAAAYDALGKREAAAADRAEAEALAGEELPAAVTAE